MLCRYSGRKRFMQSISLNRTLLSAAIELGHHELAMSQSLRRGESPVRCADDHVQECVARFINGHFALQDFRDIEVDMLRHRCDRLGISTKLNHRFDRIADHIALAGREEVYDRTGSSPQSDRFSRCSGCIHEPQSSFGRCRSWRQTTDKFRPLSELLDVAKGLLLDRG